jgi:hypothetical protein
MRGACAADDPWQGYRQKFRVFFREAYDQCDEGAPQRWWALTGERLRSTVAQFMQYEDYIGTLLYWEERTLF